jgi:hypothetical protein
MRSLTFVISLAAFVLAGTALAQSKWKTRPSVDEEFTNSTVVVVGKVVSTKDVLEPGGFTKGTFYTIEITEVLKGHPSKTTELYSENSSGRFPMTVDISYLIFAYEGVFEGVEGRRLAIDAAGNSGTVKESEKALVRARELREQRPNKSLQATRDGALSSASRFTGFGPACLSSGR